MPPKGSSGVWVPRAVKHVERAERAERAAAAAPAAGVADFAPPGAPDATWRADDLDDLDGPSAKRQRAAPAADMACGTGEEAAIKAEDEPAGGESLEDEVISGAPRLAQHIKSAAKCIKVAAMAYSLLERGAVTPRSSDAFFLVIEAAMAEPMRPIAEPKYRVAYVRLFEALLRRRHAFSVDRQDRIDEWHFALSTSFELAQADDSFGFTRAAKKVVERLERLKPDVMPPGKSAADYDPPERAARWAPMLLVCVRTAWLQSGKGLWAKPAVDGLVKAAMARRQQWSEADARQVEAWNQACKGAALQRKAHGGPGFLTSFDADAARWRAADVSVAKKKTGEGGTGSSFQN